MPDVTYQAIVAPNDDEPGTFELTVIQSYRAGISGPWANQTIGAEQDKAAADAALINLGVVRVEDWQPQDAYNGTWLVAAVTPADRRDLVAKAATPAEATDPTALPKVGDLVVTRFDSKPVVWDGPSDTGWSSLSFGIGSGATPKRKCDLVDVAPADLAIPTKDGRVTVEKLNARAHGIWDTSAQAYRATVPGRSPLWESKKRDAVATALRTLAIDDWHAARAAAEPDQGTTCDACGDESNSAPGLPCGRVEEDEATGAALTEPCTGTYR